MRRFATYFPHVDNVYSHRSTQKYKRKPFVSHYWDCRLKGRPPGTRKSDDPNKRKRKRLARERDLCDVKIKITEYFPGAGRQMGEELGGGGMETTVNHHLLFPSDPSGGMIPQHGPGRVFGMLGSNDGGPAEVPGSDGRRYFTIQRVNGNGGNGKFDGTAGPHKHSLEESDRVKKNSVVRRLLVEEKANKKTQVSNFLPSEIGAAERFGATLLTGKTQRLVTASLHHRLVAPFCMRVHAVHLSSSISSRFTSFSEIIVLPDPTTLHKLPLWPFI